MWRRHRLVDAAEGGIMIEIDGLAEVVLNVRDLPRALAFYEGLLGLERISPQGQPGPVFLRAGQATGSVPSLVVLAPLPAGAAEFTPPRTLNHLALTIPAVRFDEARDGFVAAGLEVRDGKHPVLAVRTMYVTDPDGNEVEFISPELAG
jgi:catechol 2,3-dioxygenase-like lactoylglutathione lyase family enzyme